MNTIFDPLTQDLYAQIDEANELPVNETATTAPKNTVKSFAASLAGSRTTEAEPNWHALLLAASNQAEKHHIRAARDAWQDEQKFKAHQARAAADQARIDALKNVPLRNKAFYDQLARTDGRVYWSPATQKLMREDKKNQGLGFYSKK